MFVDLRRNERSDEELLEWIRQVRRPLGIVATKVDKIARGKRQAHLQNIRGGLSLTPNTPIQLFSAQSNEGVRETLDVLQVFLEGRNKSG